VPIALYDKKSNGAKSYKDLAGLIIKANSNKEDK